ncbi:MAG: DUF3467 domain-containing protein [Planctomycetota bacterium]|jgi:hypothetical protein
MSDDEIVAPRPESEEDRRGVLNLITERAQTSYANLAVLTSTPEEIVLNFGVNVNPITESREVNVEITNRIIMSYPSAKRLALTLGNVIQRYESRNGVIELRRPEPPAQGPEVPGGPWEQ